MKFNYVAKDSKGEIVKSTEEAVDKSALFKLIQEKGMTLMSLEEVTEKSIFKKQIKLFERVSVHEKIVFSKNLAVMLNAGLPLSRALTIMSRQTKNAYLKTILEKVEEVIRGGKSFHEALEDYPKVFPKLFVSMVAAGEESGKLSESLDVIGTQTEKSYLLAKKVKGAMMYPSIIILAMMGIATFMLIYVVPTLTQTFKDLNVDLPVSTQMVIFVSDFMRNNIILGLSIILGVIFAGYSWAKSESGKRFFNWFSLKIPVIGGIIKEVNAARTARTLASLLTSGVSVVESLRITGDVLQNVYYKEVLAEAGKKVQVGEQISAVFTKAENLYPIYVGEMIAVGEETGELGGMLQKVASFFEDEVEQKTKDMSTIIEPFLMIVVGIAVGFFALSMITPMYSLVDKI